jgi:hypothetical protein
VQRGAVRTRGQHDHISRRYPGTPLAGKVHPGATASRQQSRQQSPIVHRKVTWDRQRPAHLRTQGRLGPARLPAGQQFHLPSDPGQLLGEPVEVGAVAGIYRDHERAPGPEARVGAGGDEFTGECRPAAQRGRS